MLRPLSLLAGLAIGAIATLPAAHAQTLPEGPYQRSCSGAAIQDGTLIATCRTADGGSRVSSLPLPDRCPGIISNNDGWLKCTPPPAYGE